MISSPIPSTYFDSSLQYKNQKRYILIFFFVFSFLFFPVFLGILYLNYIEHIASKNVEIEASDWQDKSQGLTKIGFANGVEKIYKLDRIRKIINQKKDVNTIVFGSSTSETIKSSMFPQNQKVYNFSQSANPTPALVSELEALVEYEGFSYFVVPFDWALARLQSGTYFDLWKTPRSRSVPWGSMMRDSLTSSKVKMLLSKFWSICTANNRYETFKEILFLSKVENKVEYACPDGNIERSYDVSLPKCSGFYPDGSRNYSNYKKPLDKQSVTDSSLLLAVPKYQGLIPKRVPSELFNRLSKIIKKVKDKKGDIFFYLPPLLPGLEKKLLESQSGSRIIELKNEIHKFALENEVQVIDAGQSEKFGCEASDFIDTHHAIHTCYEKILPQFHKKRHMLGYGLLNGDQFK